MIKIIFVLGLIVCMQDFQISNQYNKDQISSSKSHPLESHFTKYGDVQIRYQNKGKGGDALIFIHGWACNSSFWRNQVDSFQQSRVITIDLPGHGKSDKPKVDYTIDYFAGAIKSVMDDAQVERVVLVGHSMGAIIARQFYRLYPDKIRGLVIVDGAIQPFFYKMLKQFSSPTTTNSNQRKSQLINQLVIAVKDERLKKEIRESMLSTDDEVATSTSNSVMDEKVYVEDPIKVPVLAIMVKKPFWPENMEESLRSFIPDLQFHMWQDVSHFLMMEKPDDFNRVLKEFISRSKQDR